MGPAPTVSVCIPTYLGARHLRQSIDSVLAQTFTDFELVIVDDHSSDETFGIASGITDSRIRCLRNERRLGAEANWTRAVLEARGRYVKVLPQDDLLAPACLARQVAAFEADTANQLVLVFSPRVIIDTEGRPLFKPRPMGSRALRLDGRTVFRRCLRRGTNVVGEPGVALFRRQTAEMIGGFDGSFPYVIDLDYYLRLLEHGDAEYIPEALSSFRLSPAQWSVAIGRSQARQFLGLAAKMAQRPHLRAGGLDLTLGRLLAPANNVARRLMYWFTFRN